MEEVVLKATRRSVIGKQVNALRRAGKLPGVLYGRGFQPLPVSFEFRETSRILAHLPSSALVTIEVDGERHTALVREKQRDYLRGSLRHVDFQIVSMREKLRVEVPIEVRGEAPAVRDLNGVPVTGLETLEVECFPQDLPTQIVVDISGLKNIGSGIYVRDIQPPANVEILADPDELIYLITAPAGEEEEAVIVGGVEPEVIERGKKEEEEF